MVTQDHEEYSDSSSEDLESRCEVTVRILDAPVVLRTFALPAPCCVADLQAELGALGQGRPLWSERGRLGPEDILENGEDVIIPSKEDALMLSMLPNRAQVGLNPETLVDVALDLGMPPVIHERRPGDNDVTVRELDVDELTQEELDGIQHHQLLGGRWTSDNRSGVAGTLHRVSRNVDPTDGSVVGITIRMAHAQYGMLDQVDGLKKALRNKKSLLVLGPPGSGKTTMLREVARLHNEEFKHRVVIVDTSSEIAGFGKVRHPAVGRTTRRRKVADRDKQYKDMLEAVQNDTPQVLVIDEIGSAQEVEAACSIGFRGIVLVATAHACSLQEAMNNPALQPLFGSFEKSTISDETARRTYGGRKFVQERRSEPVFQSLVELGRDAGDQWTIYKDLKSAIDDILSYKWPQPNYYQPSARYSLENTANRSSWGRKWQMKESSGHGYGSGLYLLCFDGGTNWGEAICPGGAGAVLKQLKANKQDRDAKRNRRTWKMYSAHSSPEQMEYAGLLIGLRGVLDILDSLDPPAEKIFIEGDCRFVTDRHGASKCAAVLRSEHTDVHNKMDTLADLVNEALAKLRQRVEVPHIQWRRRGRNKTADRLTHEARDQRRTDEAVRISAEERSLLQGYQTDALQGMFNIFEAHPLLKMTPDFLVAHPKQDRCSGFMGMKFMPHSSENFSLVVRMEGSWGPKDSFLLGLMTPDAHCLNDSHGFTAADVGYWFSPKSGRIFAPEGTHFLLPALRASTHSAARRKLGGSGEPSGFGPGARWGITYQRGTLAIYHSAGDEPLQRLEVVKWPSSNFLPHQRYCAVLLFKPRPGHGDRPRPARCFQGKAAKAGGAAPRTPGNSKTRSRSDAPSLRLMGSFDNKLSSRDLVAARSHAKAFLLRSFLDFARRNEIQLEQISALQVKLLLQVAVETFALQKTSAIPWLNHFFRKNGRITAEAKDCLLSAFRPAQCPATGSGLGRLRVSDDIRVPAGTDCLFRHPQPAKTFGYIVFEPGKRSLAVRIKGEWARRDRVMIGFVPDKGWGKNVCTLHPVDLGYFVSLHSVSMVGRDGTNFHWGRQVADAWAWQFIEQGHPGTKQELERSLRIKGMSMDIYEWHLSRYLALKSSDWYVQLTAGNTMEVFVKPRVQTCRGWVKLGAVPWRGGSELPKDQEWCPAIIFLPRKGMGPPKCALSSSSNAGGTSAEDKGTFWQEKPKPKLSQRFKRDEFPKLEILDTKLDRFVDMPRFDPQKGGIEWPDV